MDELLGKSLSPVTYVKQSEIVSDHKHSLTYTEYMSILKAYAKIVFEELVAGKLVELPSRMGSIQLIKYLTPHKKVVDWKKTKEVYGEYNLTAEKKKVVYTNNAHTNGYSVKLQWKKLSNIRNRRFYNGNLARKKMLVVAKILKTDMTAIYKIQES